jgi:phage/plasmid primase-like uncharacterized protein
MEEKMDIETLEKCPFCGGADIFRYQQEGNDDAVSVFGGFCCDGMDAYAYGDSVSFEDAVMISRIEKDWMSGNYELEKTQ